MCNVCFVCLFVCFCIIEGCFTVLEIMVLVECTSAHLIFQVVCIKLCEFDQLHCIIGEEDSAVYGYLRNGTLDGIIHSQGYVCMVEV